MPVNPEFETKKGIDKNRYSLSLKRNNATYLSNENKKPNEEVRECKTGKPSNSNNKENKPLKRPSNNFYLNTLNAAKKLKPLSETPIPAEAELEIIKKPIAVAMLNGHHSDNHYGGDKKKIPIGTLSNLGNTCFLNSVLYTLRYAPRFLHNLHHLVSDLASVEQKLGSIRLKSSSLGRSAVGLASSGTRSWSNKDLLSLGQADNCSGKSKMQITTEKLHETYMNLRTAESKCLNSSAETPEPYAADPFLSALREVNSTFEGNRQQDAHELLLCLLDTIRETCRALSTRAAILKLQENGDSNGVRQPSLDNDTGKAMLGNLRKSWKKRKEAKGNDKRNSPTDDRAPSPEPERDERSRPGWDFVGEDFEGTMVVRTVCLECEAVTERSQAVCELCVPVPSAEEGGGAEPFRLVSLTSELLRDQNKYWCERCLRYNEARRSVAYSRLPPLLVMQLKRFSGGMEKITRYAPTPLRMPCFCDLCVERSAVHTYNLWAVIMHLGQTLTGGHYVAYTREGEWANTGSSANATTDACERDGGGDASSAHTTSFIRTLFNRPRPTATGCNARDCCAPRPRSEPCWLVCDDDVVRPISDEEFEDLLSPEPKIRTAATPYLLFYVKSEVG